MNKPESQIFEMSLEGLPELAKSFANKLRPKDCICLTGEMGAGKTTLSYFLVSALLGEVSKEFSSPTFTLMNQYANAKGTVVNHVDLYRLENFADFFDLDLVAEWDAPNSFTLVEWGEKFPELKSRYTHTLKIQISTTHPEKRLVEWIEHTDS